ncbi:hypothetical protein BJ322DRAFT_1111725 [Thelephora terrestris]|uniref:Uncharacterized protein n=1 Tax=Thelephora terrestris TaxID=56493 RepID=A0A9P6L4E7_9AGAM|nr:hypothetical protein BJ322DRAFT_1111725 [Thelephora terrestris]
METQGWFWYEQDSLEDAMSEAVGAKEIYEKLGAARDLGDVGRLIEAIEEKMGSRAAPATSDSSGEFFSSCAITHHLASEHNTQSKLQPELDQALGHERDPIASSEIVKRLSYYEAVINKALWMHSTSSLGLPCIVPEGG